MIPIITLFIFALLILNEKYKSVKNAQLLENGILLSNKISLIIHELQKERGSSSGFIGSKGDEKFKQILDAQRKLSDDKIKDFSDFLDSVDMSSYGENLLASINNAKKELENIKQARLQTDSLKILPKDIISTYTKTIEANIAVIVSIAASSTNYEY
ncbi:nitrate- and nitrite sensing domain-containing protein [uncultured Campylobacter sp.]|uniref:nitrate- and nitrite sensing domain-containing protein n=1 Tax=uncultured Campylobacter sp. TaxID=218934 RepID=UPI00261328AF|nr:nitrate- and nitrite sensing domain-containing protein [uncultured Campylobacter sp.]